MSFSDPDDSYAMAFLGDALRKSTGQFTKNHRKKTKEVLNGVKAALAGLISTPDSQLLAGENASSSTSRSK